MKHVVIAAAIAVGLAACGQAPSGADTGAQQSAAAAGDPCSLIPDTTAVFGREVTAQNAPMPNICQWQSADAAVTGSIIVHGAGWSAVSDAQQAYDQMLEPFAAMTTQPVEGLGDQAISAGIGAQTQIVFRKGGVAANVGATSDDPALTSAALAERIARAAADHL